MIRKEKKMKSQRSISLQLFIPRAIFMIKCLRQLFYHDGLSILKVMLLGCHEMMRKNDKTKSQQSISVQLFIPHANPPYGILEAQLRKGCSHHAGWREDSDLQRVCKNHEM